MVFMYLHIGDTYFSGFILLLLIGLILNVWIITGGHIDIYIQIPLLFLERLA